MKRLSIISAIFVVVVLARCNSSSDNKELKDSTDSTSLSNPVTIDTVKHPSGVDNSSVISTDTAAMNVQNSIKKAGSAAKEKK